MTDAGREPVVILLTGVKPGRLTRLEGIDRSIPKRTWKNRLDLTGSLDSEEAHCRSAETVRGCEELRL